MTIKPVRDLFALTLVLAVAGGTRAWSQEGGKTKDEALDSLIEKLANPGDKPPSKSDKKVEPSKEESTRTAKPGTPGSQGQAKTKSKDSPGATASKEKAAKGSAGQTAKPPTVKPKGSEAVPTKDQELDSFLEKLGETKDAPTPEDHPRNSSPGGQPPKQPSGAEKPDRAKLGGKDKDLDERLEEYTGKKKKRSASDEQRSGPVGEIIKEMRDVEQRLNKPDTSEDTRNKQKQIVRKIDTLIEQVKKSGSSAGRLMLRRVRQPGGQQPGQPGDQQGALARGAGPMKPAKAVSQHSTAGGKDIWGHLPADLKYVMEASFREQPLHAKAEIISRYFLSVAKGKPVREE
jgi:hypothetical protein